MTTQKDRIEAAIRHIQTSVDIDPWAMELAVDALKAQIDKDTNVPNNDDIISRQAALERLQHSKPEVGADGSKERYRRLQWIADCNAIEEVPSAQPEPCEDAVSRKLMYELGATCMARRDENGELVALGRLDMLPSVQPDNSCDGCKYENADDGVLVPCGFCKRSHPDNYERRTDGTD